MAETTTKVPVKTAPTAAAPVKGSAKAAPKAAAIATDPDALIRQAMAAEQAKTSSR